MSPQLLAAAYLLQRMHGVAFAAAFLEEYDVPREWALSLLADRPPERPIPTRYDRAQYPNKVETSERHK